MQDLQPLGIRLHWPLQLQLLGLWQEGHDLLDISTLGGAGKRLNDRWIPHLLQYRKIYLAYDQDGPGQNGSKKLSEISSRFINWPPPFGDLIEYHQNNGNIRSLIQNMAEV